MPDNAIESARERLAEQIMSDERLLGTLPEAATELVLDHALARLDDAAARAVSVEALEAEAEAIRADAWSVTERASTSADPEQAVRVLFVDEAETSVMGEPPEPEGMAIGWSGPEAEDTAALQPAHDPELPAEVMRETAPAPHEQDALPDVHVETAGTEPPSLWERVRGMWRGFGRDE
jgi:hypothetical protein